MFVVKKFISFFLSPLVLVFLLAFIALYFMLKENSKRAKIFIILSFSWLFIISYQPLSISLLDTLESQYKKLEIIPDDIEYLLALGGDSQGRAYEVLRLYHKNRNLKIITSGHEPKNRDGALHTARILAEAGLPAESIIVKVESKDTKEEVVMMKELVGDKPFILVTAAYHMPRSMALFQKSGLNPIAAPTNFLSGGYDWLNFLSIDALHDVEISLHEYIGLLWYKLKGDI